MNGALDGIRVVALEHAVAAPLATRHLADLGATVIKVERPGGGDFARGYDRRARGLSSHFVWCNRGKQSLTLDIKAEAGRAILARLLGTADVLIQNLAPGAAARLGLDEAALRPTHPGLILCEISGYGADGPDTARKAYDLLIQAEAGFLSVTGRGDDAAKAGISIADIAAGMYAYSGILAALLRRGRAGTGCHIEISMLEALAEWMGFPLYFSMDGAPPPPRAGASHATIYPYGPFHAADGDVLFGIQNDREWAAFAREVLGAPALASDPRFATTAARGEHRAALAAILEPALARHDVAALTARLDRAGIASATLNDMHGLWSHAQLAARGRWRTVDSPAGPLPALLPPGMTSAPAGAVPALGAHTETILTELGYAHPEIDALRQAKVV